MQVLLSTAALLVGSVATAAAVAWTTNGDFRTMILAVAPGASLRHLAARRVKTPTRA
jgi:uncharacterized membrane protein AbrB (regulator of aidB expression)